MALSSQTVHQRIQDSERRFRLSRSARFLMGGAAASFLFLVIFLTLDAWVHFGAVGRWAGLCLTVSALAAGAVLGWRSWRARISEAAMARRIEMAAGGGGNVLISAVQFDGELAADSPFRAVLFNEMRDPFPQVQWDKVFDSRLLKRVGMILGGVLVVLFAWAVVKPNYFANSAARLFMPASKIAPLTRTKIDTIIPGDDIVVHGREVRLSATLAGEVPKVAWVWYRESGSSWQKALMDRDAGQPVFEFRWKEVRAPIEYYIQAGDAQSETHRITVRPKTAMKSRTAEIEPPAYTGLPRQAVADFTVLQNVVPGSTVAMTLEFNNELAGVKASDDKGDTVSAEKVNDARWKVTAKISTNKTLKLEYRDTANVADSATMQIAVKPDEAPKIAVTEPAEGAELVATKDATLAVKFAATDVFGLGSVAVYQSTNDKEDAKLVQEWTAAKGLKNFETTLHIPLKDFAGDEERVTFRVVAKDQNDVTGPGVTMSRPLVVTLKTADKLEKQVDEAATKLQKGLEALIKLQQANLDATKIGAQKKEAAAFAPLVESQVKISDAAGQLLASAELISPDVRNDLRAMIAKEMKDAVIALRNAGPAPAEPRAKFLNTAITLESAILARLQGAPAAVEEDAKKNQISELISGVEDLLKRERALHKDTAGATEDKAAALGDQQDALADKAAAVRKNVDTDSKNAAIGDEDFRKRLARVALLFGELKVYEDMLSAAEQLGSEKVQPALPIQLRVIGNLAKMVELLNQWQLAEAEKKADDLKKDAEAMQQKLDRLAEIQKEIVEKSKDMARKDQFDKNDIAAQSEITEQKELMKDVLEQMTTDLQAFPDMKPGNEMKGEIVSILEDVQQADKQDVAEGKLKPQDIAVQKEQGILDGIEAAKKIAADIEMWLPNKNEKEKWLLENFDKTEMPEIPNLPLADAFEDIVGDLLDTQKEMEKDIQDAASNQAFAMNPANGWEIRDGPMPGFGAQGKSGNEKPNHNEQMGRSSGGRQGMSDGEMAGDTASNLKGDTPDARRTKDPLQAGQVKDDGGISETRATGGGKAGGFGDRAGMEGNAPLRAVAAPRTPAANAAAVKQALLAEKTAKTVAQASLLYMRSDGLQQVAQLMDENAMALKEGRMKDAQSLHQRIVGRLKELKSGVTSGEVVAFGTQDAARGADKQLLGGSEGEAPAQYRDMVSEYFRTLVEEK